MLSVLLIGPLHVLYAPWAPFFQLSPLGGLQCIVPLLLASFPLTFLFPFSVLSVVSRSSAVRLRRGPQPWTHAFAALGGESFVSGSLRLVLRLGVRAFLSFFFSVLTICAFLATRCHRIDATGGDLSLDWVPPVIPADGNWDFHHTLLLAHSDFRDNVASLRRAEDAVSTAQAHCDLSWHCFQELFHLHVDSVEHRFMESFFGSGVRTFYARDRSGVRAVVTLQSDPGVAGRGVGADVVALDLD